MNVPLTPLDFLERARRLFGALPAVVDGGQRFTYAEYAARCHALGAALSDGAGPAVAPGDRVAWLGPNTHELLEAYYGVLLAGAILVPLNIRLAPAELQAIVEDCSPRLLVVHPDLEYVARSLVGPEQWSLGRSYEERLVAHSGAFREVADVVDDEDAVCEIFYTSGTTGTPKGAMLTHRNLATHAVDAALSMACTHRDVVLHTIPLFHVNGWGTPHWVTLLGAEHVLLRRFDPAEVLRSIGACGVTRLHLVPTMARMLLECDAIGSTEMASMVQVTVGGAAPGPSLLAELEEAFGCEVICGYGLTEAAPQVTKALPTRAHDGPLEEDAAARRRLRAATGLPIIGVDLRVFDDADREVAWDSSSMGEIRVRSNHVMAGYWNQPDATADVLRGGWLRTGDLATVDGEGYVTIVDRRKDIIVSGGENVASVEVEHALTAHPLVAEAAVVAMADEKWGEVPRAFVVARRGAVVGAEELREFVASRLARFKVPARIDVVAELPKGGSGKVLKDELRRIP